MRRLLLIATTIAAFSLTLGLRADAPHVYAIRGARIVTAAGAPIDSGTVVLRRGVIDAIGPAVPVPADAEIIDGKGLTVYPGLIDLGNTRLADQPIPPQPQNPRTTADLERWKRDQILKPQARALDAVKADDAELTKLAAAGITSALAVPSGDVITGQSALVTVAAPPEEPQIGNVVEPRRGVVVMKAPVALHVTFPNRPRAGGNAYPESLMGVIALGVGDFHGLAVRLTVLGHLVSLGIGLEILAFDVAQIRRLRIVSDGGPGNQIGLHFLHEDRLVEQISWRSAIGPEKHQDQDRAKHGGP